eukprot:7549907-Pyramimonas_sp.AAC.1
MSRWLFSCRASTEDLETETSPRQSISGCSTDASNTARAWRLRASHSTAQTTMKGPVTRAPTNGEK